MLPSNVLSSEFIPAEILPPRNVPKDFLVDYELGGVALNNPSQGLEVKVWTGQYIDGAVVLEAEGVPPTTLFSLPDITEFQFTFDQNMQPSVAYATASGVAALRWWDGTVPAFSTLTLPAGSRSPRCTLDDKRRLQTSVSDVVLFYIRGDALYMRVQRDRFTIEYPLVESAPWLEDRFFGQVGMGRNLRLQLQLMGPPE